MGDPKFLRRTYETPKHPWEQTRMDEERVLLKEFGLSNKRELWKAQSLLRNYRRQARLLQARLRAKEPQAEKEVRWLLDSLTRQGLLPVGSPTLDDVLALTPKALIERRLQWLVFAKGLATSTKAARQYIVHGHISVGSHRVTRPGYLVRRDEEGTIAYDQYSPLADENHSIRVAIREKAQPASPSDVPAPSPSNSPEVNG